MGRGGALGGRESFLGVPGAELGKAGGLLEEGSGQLTCIPLPLYCLVAKWRNNLLPAKESSPAPFTIRLPLRERKFE